MEDEVFSTSVDGSDFNQITLMLASYSTGFLCQPEAQDQDLDASALRDMPDSGGLKVVKWQHGRPPTLPMDVSNSDSESIDIQSTGTMTDVEEHMEVENVARPAPPRTGKLCPHSCPVCCVECVSGLALECHLKSLHPLSRCFSCSDCDASFNNIHEVTSHKANVHWIQKVACKYCDYHTVSKAKMRQYVQIHTAGLKCHTCHKQFPSLSALLMHE